MRLLVAFALAACAAQAQHRTILAVGAHAGDMEVAAGAVLIKHVQRGDRAVILHLTLGEGGNPRLAPQTYGAQKRSEALAAAKAIGAEAIFAPYRDGELPDDEEARRYIAGVLRRVKPTHVLTHWRHSLHRDHAAAHAIVVDAVLLASLGEPAHRGVRGVYFTENWEDAEDYRPFVFVDVTGHLEAWKQAATKYEFIRGGVSSFPYLDYYESLARLRGAEAGKRHAVTFQVPPEARRRVLDALP
jgi:LmbE family N-acetylglucosaminyl deacetylase